MRVSLIGQLNEALRLSVLTSGSGSTTQLTSPSLPNQVVTVRQKCSKASNGCRQREILQIHDHWCGGRSSAKEGHTSSIKVGGG